MGAIPRAANHEAAGFMASAAFVCLASVRDVYLGGLFQQLSPLDVAVVAFLLCSVIFLPIALARRPEGLRAALRHPRELFWINATSALAWISFFFALGATEPLLVQVLFSGVGPLSIAWIDRLIPGAAVPAPPSRVERAIHLGLLTTLGLALLVVLCGLSGAGPQPLGRAALGAALAVGAGFSISVNTVLCRQLHDAGVDPIAMVSVRFLGAIVLALALAVPAGHGFSALHSAGALPTVLGASVLLVVLPIYVSQVGISLASPLTVRVVLAVAPVLIFVLQLADGRMSASPYSLTAAVLYGVFAVSAAVTRRRAIRTAVLAGTANP